MNLGLLYGGGQVQGVQRAGVIITTRPGEGERHHRRLLPLGQEVQQREPHVSVLGGGSGKEDALKETREKTHGTRRQQRGNVEQATWLADVTWEEVFLVPNDWLCLLVRSFLASTAA